MIVEIDQRSDVPIYEQLHAQSPAVHRSHRGR